MTWYTVIYGTWADMRGVVRVAGTYSRREAVEAAQKAANETGEAVTVLTERPTGRGLENDSFQVLPEH